MLAHLRRRDPRLADGLNHGSIHPAANQQNPATIAHRYEPQEFEPATLKFPNHDEFAEPVVELDFSDLAKLDDQSIADVFQAAEPEVALLALTGADNSLVKRILKQLSGRDAKQLKKAIRQVGPVQLRDIEDAQRQIGRLAGRLSIGNSSSQPRNTGRLAAAA